jgi:hypothetical protein
LFTLPYSSQTPLTKYFLYNFVKRDALFRQKYPNTLFDRALWKQFWYKHQKYHTLCLSCIADKKEEDRKFNEMKRKSKLQKNPASTWREMMLNDASEEIIKDWYRAAHTKVFGSNGKIRKQIDIQISDDDEDDFSHRKWIRKPLDINSSTSSIASLWVRTARAKLQRDRAERFI